MNLTWKRTLRTPSSDRFLALRDGKDLAAVDQVILQVAELTAA